jgi:hypothetical protein
MKSVEKKKFEDDMSLNKWQSRFAQLTQELLKKNQVDPKSNPSVFWAFSNNIYPAIRVIDKTLKQFDEIYYDPIRTWDYYSSNDGNLLPESDLEFQVNLFDKHNLLQDLIWIRRTYNWKWLKVSGKQFFNIDYSICFEFQPFQIRLHSCGAIDNLEFEFAYNQIIKIEEWEQIAEKIGAHLLSIIEDNLRQQRLI